MSLLPASGTTLVQYMLHLLCLHSVTTKRLACCVISLRRRHYWRDSVSNHLPHHLFRRRSKKTSKLRVTGLCAGNSPGTGEFPAQMASNAENVSIWWRLHVRLPPTCCVQDAVTHSMQHIKWNKHMFRITMTSQERYVSNNRSFIKSLCGSRSKETAKSA